MEFPGGLYPLTPVKVLAYIDTLIDAECRVSVTHAVRHSVAFAARVLGYGAGVASAFPVYAAAEAYTRAHGRPRRQAPAIEPSPCARLEKVLAPARDWVDDVAPPVTEVLRLYPVAVLVAMFFGGPRYDDTLHVSADSLLLEDGALLYGAYQTKVDRHGQGKRGFPYRAAASLIARSA